MENLHTSYESKVWTDDFIIPKTLNLKNIINNNPSTTTFFMIKLRVQEFLQYIHDDAAEDSICKILSSVGVTFYRMLPIIRKVSSFARNMMSLPANSSSPLLPIVLGIEVNSWDPGDAAIVYERKFGRTPEIEEEEPTVKCQRIKDEHRYKVYLTPVLGIRYMGEA